MSRSDIANVRALGVHFAACAVYNRKWTHKYINRARRINIPAPHIRAISLPRSSLQTWPVPALIRNDPITRRVLVNAEIPAILHKYSTLLEANEIVPGRDFFPDLTAHIILAAAPLRRLFALENSLRLIALPRRPIVSIPRANSLPFNLCPPPLPSSLFFFFRRSFSRATMLRNQGPSRFVCLAHNAPPAAFSPSGQSLWSLSVSLSLSVFLSLSLSLLAGHASVIPNRSDASGLLRNSTRRRIFFTVALY